MSRGKLIGSVPAAAARFGNSCKYVVYQSRGPTFFVTILFMPKSRPDRCPECGHAPLLPVEQGRCPECAFPYDRQTVVWRPRRPWRIYLAFANTLVFSPWLFRFLEVTLLWGQWPSRSVMIGAAISGTCLLWALPRLRVVLSDGHRYAALTPRGIQARTPRDYYDISWEDMVSIKILFGIPVLHARGHSNAILLEWIFDTDREVADFIEAVAAAQSSGR